MIKVTVDVPVKEGDIQAIVGDLGKVSPTTGAFLMGVLNLIHSGLQMVQAQVDALIDEDSALMAADRVSPAAAVEP